MKKYYAALFISAMIAGPAFAQTAATPSNDESVMENDSTMNNNDAALPGGSESTATSANPTTILPNGSTTPPMDSAGGKTSQPMVPAGDPQAEVEESTPSGGIVPGQTPE